ncbi:hypothetical protein C0991_006519 [Blastosporella zonata]|nr:hypothetical protein C0991_006519 [Blastosporella zonata]
MAPGKCWLLKAEPDSRVVKGKDVKFSVDDFESVKTSPWEGVRNYEARNLMKEMKAGEKASQALPRSPKKRTPTVSPSTILFASLDSFLGYLTHSDTAWDASHPYYDAKTKKEDPRWFMVDLTFVSRVTHFVPLALLRFLCDSTTLPPEIDYIEEDGYKALKGMDLVGRGRLSVQRVEESAWNAIVALSEKGGWEEIDLKDKKRKKPLKSIAVKATATTPRKPSTRKKRAEADTLEEGVEDSGDKGDDYSSDEALKTKRGTKRKKAKRNEDDDHSAAPRRRVKRNSSHFLALRFAVRILNDFLQRLDFV